MLAGQTSRRQALTPSPNRLTPVWRRLRLDQQVFLLALGAGVPGAVTALWILWTEPYTPKVQWTLTVIILATLFGLAASVRTRVVVPLQTLANLLAALREDDFSIRGRTANPDDPLGAALIEINALAETLHEQRLGAVEATLAAAHGHGTDRRRGVRVRSADIACASSTAPANG